MQASMYTVNELNLLPLSIFLYFLKKMLDQIHENVQEQPEESKNKIKCFFKRFYLRG